MRLIHSFIFPLLLTAFISCGEKTARQHDGCIRMKVPVMDLQQVKLSDIISEYEVIKLEFTDKSMMGYIKKIEECGDYIFVLDPLTAKSLMVFDKQGRFIRRITRSGRGPGEFIYPQDFILNEKDKTIEVIGNYKLSKYTFEGKYLSTRRNEFGGTEFIKHDSRYYFAVLGKTPYKIIQADSTGQFQKGYYTRPWTKYMHGTGYLPLRKVNGELMVKPEMCDTVFSISDDNVQVRRIIDFGEYATDYSQLENMNKEERWMFTGFKTNGNKCLIFKYLENTDHVHVRYNINSKYYHYIYDKKTDKYVHFDLEHLEDDITLQKDSWYLAGYSPKWIYYAVEPYKYKSSRELVSLLKQTSWDEASINALLEDSNPILLKVKYKRF